MLFILFLVINAEPCDKRTKIYDLVGNSNQNNFYFDIKTYTESTVSMNNQAYRDKVKASIPCNGQWCVDNQWKCLPGNSKDCFNVEHIVARSNDILDIYGCPVDIEGNLIMAYGAWNQQLSNSYYGEKAEIYGSVIFKSAYRSIYKACYHKDPTTYPEELCLSNNTGLHILIVLLVISLIIIIVGIFLFMKYKKESTEEIYADIKSSINLMNM
jgi:hypothetical protein